MDQNTLKQIIKDDDLQILILDGGVSTHLEDIIVATKKSESTDKGNEDSGNVFPYRELWSSSLLLSTSGQDLILRGHKDWLSVGVDIISTVTYQCHYESQCWPHHHHHHHQGDHQDHSNCSTSSPITADVMDELWKVGIELARKSIEENNAEKDSKQQTSKKVWVAASSGCYGAALSNGAEYTGQYGLVDSSNEINTLRNFHEQKLQRILQSKPDAVAFETIPSYKECNALVKLFNSDNVQSISEQDWPVCWISLACRNETELNDGTPVSDAIQLLLKSIPSDRLHGIGFNCCNCDHLHSLVTILVQCLIADNFQNQRRAIAIYPNSGEEWDASTSTWKVGSGYTSPQEMAGQIFAVVKTIESEWTKNTPSTTVPVPSIVIGGCCRTRPATIAALRKLIDEHKNKDVVA